MDLTSEESYSVDDNESSFDIFLSLHLEEILDFCDELKDSIPYLFGNLKSTDLTQLVLYSLDFELNFDTQNIFTVRNHSNFEYFINEFHDELVTSHNKFSKYLSAFNKEIAFGNWSRFCYFQYQF